MARRLMTTEEFIEKAREVHPDANYDYSETEFTATKDKIIIICPDHGVFEQRLAHHLSGRGCPSCGKEKAARSSNSRILSLDTFIKESSEIHDGKYDYSKIDKMTSAHTKVPIICPVHGEFWQTPSSHRTNKNGCDTCRSINHRKCLTMSTSDFVKKAKEVHGNTYLYDVSEYVSARDKITITCKIHGDFQILAGNHLYYKSGCPECGKIRSRSYSSEDIPEEVLREEANLYLVRITNMETGNQFLKVGISRKKVKYRFSYAKTEGFDVEVLAVSILPLGECIKHENDILDRLDENNLRFRIRDLKETLTRGWTECFYEGDIDLTEWFGA